MDSKLLRPRFRGHHGVALIIWARALRIRIERSNGIYAKLGFTAKVMMYEPDPVNPLQNFRPWIIRTQRASGEQVDINLILNATVGQCNVLIDQREDPSRGILYACFVVEDLEAIVASL